MRVLVPAWARSIVAFATAKPEGSSTLPRRSAAIWALAVDPQINSKTIAGMKCRRIMLFSETGTPKRSLPFGAEGIGNSDANERSRAEQHYRIYTFQIVASIRPAS